MLDTYPAREPVRAQRLVCGLDRLRRCGETTWAQAHSCSAVTGASNRLGMTATGGALHAALAGAVAIITPLLQAVGLSGEDGLALRHAWRSADDWPRGGLLPTNPRGRLSSSAP
jgi:hypothetical protein